MPLRVPTLNTEKVLIRSFRAGDEDAFRALNEEWIEHYFKYVNRAAPTNSTVLIEGETGTGKELIARAIHDLSRWCGGPFVKLSCAAIPLDLLKSELHAHKQGAFTGAIAQKIGRSNSSQIGTLFLNELGDNAAPLQPTLLRILQEQYPRAAGKRPYSPGERKAELQRSHLAKFLKKTAAFRAVQAASCLICSAPQPRAPTCPWIE